MNKKDIPSRPVWNPDGPFEKAVLASGYMLSNREEFIAREFFERGQKIVPAMTPDNETITNEEKLASPVRLFIFFREGMFYPLEIPEATVADNAACNPGTLRVEDATTGEIVWEALTQTGGDGV